MALPENKGLGTVDLAGQELRNGLLQGGQLSESLRRELLNLLQRENVPSTTPVESTQVSIRVDILKTLADFMVNGQGRSIHMLDKLNVGKDNADAVLKVVENISATIATDDLKTIERKISFLSDMVSNGYKYIKTPGMRNLRRAILQKLMSDSASRDTWEFSRLFEVVADYDVFTFSDFEQGPKRMEFMRRKMSETKV